MKFRLNAKHFRKKKTFITDWFLKLRTSKSVVKKISKKSSFRGPFDKQHGKRDQILLKSELNYLYYIYWLLWRKVSWKKALIVISETLGHFANTLNVGHKYSLLNRDNLTVTIQMQLSLTKKLFLNFFFSLSKPR